MESIRSIDLFILVIGSACLFLIARAVYQLVRAFEILSQQPHSDFMDDDEFLGYCHLHSRTERALFSGVDVARLYKLAGREKHAPAGLNPQGFFTMREGIADPLVEMARKRARFTVLDGGRKDEVVRRR